MKKIIACLVLAAMTLSLVTLCVNADATEAGLSRGIEILYEQDRLSKAGEPGESIAFSHQDFLSCCGEMRMDGIVIQTPPDPANGWLAICNDRILPGSFIPSEMLDRLMFIPAGNNVSNAGFTFSFNKTGISRKCDLKFGNAGPLPETKEINCKTYRNIACFFELADAGSGERVKIEKSPGKGMVRVDHERGIVCYTPGRNITGKDSFKYSVINQIGQRGKPAAVNVEIIRSRDNLFFIDCAGKPFHNGAVFACEAGILDYSLNEDHLPVFDPDDPLSEKEIRALTRYSAGKTGDNSIAANRITTEMNRREAIALVNALDPLIR